MTSTEQVTTTVRDHGGHELYQAARDAMERGDLSLALSLIESARSEFEQAGDLVGAARTNLGRMNVLDDLGRHHESVETGLELQRQVAALSARPTSDEGELLRWLSAAAAENLGASLGWLGRHDAASSSLLRADADYRALGLELDRARVSANLGVERLEIGDAPTALHLLEDARNVLLREGDVRLARRAQVYAAQAKALAGRYGDALADLDATSSDPVDESPLVDDLRLEIVRTEILATMNLWPEVLESIDRLYPRLVAMRLIRDCARVDLVRSRALLFDGRRREAAKAARGAVASLVALDVPAIAGRARLALAACLQEPLALREVQMAERAFAACGERWGVAEAAVMAARLSSSTTATASWLRRAEDAGVEAYPDLWWQVLWMRGQEAASDRRPRAAEGLLRCSLSTLRSIRGSVESDALRTPFMTGRRGPQETLVRTLLESGDVDGARQATSAERSWALEDRRTDWTGGQQREDPDPGTVLYQQIADGLVAFVTTDDGETELVELEVTASQVDSLTRRLDAQWRRLADPRMFVHLRSLREATDRILHELYLALVGPIETHLVPESPLTVIPTGRLGAIPFHALHDGERYLVDRRQVSMAPSDRVLDAPLAELRTLVVGVADDMAPAIIREAEQVAEVTGGTLLVGADATARTVRTAAAAHDVVHLACHSEFRSDNPWLSGVALADGWTRAYELARWGLDRATIVLASCSSGRQGNVGEDELLGMPRAFLAAGASAVVMNLWPAHDATSVELMTDFHSSLAATGAVEALRSAQRRAQTRHPHPYLWAPTVVYGAHHPSPARNSEVAQ